MTPVSELLAAAVKFHQAGQLAQAQTFYRQILAIAPNHPEALHLLGVSAHQMGNNQAAVQLIERAIGIEPTRAAYHSNLGEAYRKLGQFETARACFERALALDATMLGAHFNLANTLRDAGRLDQAIASYRQALALRPDFGPAQASLGHALNEQGIRLKDSGRFAEAVACFQEAVRWTPASAEAHVNLGASLHAQGRIDEASACYEAALKLEPTLAQAHNNLGNAWRDKGRLTEAAQCYERALQFEPTLAGAIVNLGGVYKDQGRLADAIACYRRALQSNPDYADAHSNLCYALYFSPDHDARSIFEEHQRWNERHAAPFSLGLKQHGNDRSPERVLKIGYVSSDFSLHPIGRFIAPLLENHDRNAVSVYCYSSVRQSDHGTVLCRRNADVWRDVASQSDGQLARTICEDRIDILVDLTMNLAENRLLAFARKPAPVQVTYLAYSGATGLTAIDYRLTDPYLDPPGEPEFYSERSIHLPRTYWCYQPLLPTPPVNELPALRNRYVTFGCLNNFCKVSEPILAVWRDLLRAVCGSRLLLSAKDGDHRDRVRQFFAGQDVAPERLTFLDRTPLESYFSLYHDIDVALDTHPYGGGTTTCDALWMGVPVVSLTGKTAVGRAGLSILSNVGKAEWVARNGEEYVRIAAELAQNHSELAQCRASLRGRMQASPLMDQAAFAKDVESAYRQMWREWCARG